MKLIKINTDHYVIVDNSEIKDGDWMIRDGDQPTLVTPNFWWDFGVPYKKITHSTQPLDNRGYWASCITHMPLQEIKELIGEVDVEEKANQYLKNNYPEYLNPKEKMAVIEDYKTVYNQALEDNKEKKYTEEDLRRYHNIMCLHGNVKGEEYIQSLQFKTEWEVEFIDNKLKLL